MPTQVRLNTQAIALSLTNAEVATAAAIAQSKLAAPTLASSTYAVPANADEYLADRMYSLQQVSNTASLGSSVAVAGSNLASVGSALALNASATASNASVIGSNASVTASAASVIGSNASVTASSALATAVLGSNLASVASSFAGNVSITASNAFSLAGAASNTASLGSSVAVAGSNLASVASSIAVAGSALASTGAAIRHSHKIEEAPSVATASSTLYTLATAPIDWPSIHVNGVRVERAYDWTAASASAQVFTFLAGAIPTTADRVRADIVISN